MMKKQLFTMFILAAGLALFLGLAMPAQGAEMKMITVTPSFNIYLPIIGRPRPPCSVAPALISPATGSNLNNLIPLFKWNSGNDFDATKFRLQVAQDSAFTQLISTWTHGPLQGAGEIRFPWNFDHATTYYWRVYLICGNSAQSPYSEVRSFTTGSGGIILPAPDPIAPRDEVEIPTTTATLKWSSVGGAVEYRVNYRIFRTTGDDYALVNGTQTTIGGLSGSTTYEWWASVRNDYAWSITSVHWTFSTR